MVYHVDDLAITTGKTGAREYAKVSYPIRYGAFDEIRSKDFVFQFDLLGELKYVQGRREDWPNPGEWLKRSRGNDWTYYSAGDYGGIVERFGEYYFPCLSYPSNSIMGDRPFRSKGVRGGLSAGRDLMGRIKMTARGSLPPDIKDFLNRAAAHDPRTLATRAACLHRLIGGRASVLPPDARHADYEVIPLVLADGCLYNCSFCRVKSGQGLKARSGANVAAQIAGLKEFYGPELRNYSGLFLGQHDALKVGAGLIEFAAEAAYDSLGFAHSFMRRPTLFLFGSADSLLEAEEPLFRWLDETPFFTYINAGLESCDAATLSFLGKPLSVGKVRDALVKMGEINRKYERIEVSANFVIGLHLPPSHLDSLLATVGLMRSSFGKGTLYISPMVRDDETGAEENRALLAQFWKIKKASALPVFLYLIQRL
ncbi:MAG TPA: hypothetical protein VLW86_08230 [Syntrophorhabdales bacterium]|nr:hypothetical protein [Syntrophorhabdales bacterium]